MRRETADLLGSGLLLAALLTATFATLAPPAAASVAPSSARTSAQMTAATVASTTVIGSTVASAAGALDRGRSLFYVKGCVSCHAKIGERAPTAAVGPDLSGLASRAAERRPGMSAEAYVRESIKSPSAFIVPPYGSATFGMPDLGLSDDEIDALSAFLLGTP